MKRYKLIIDNLAGDNALILYYKTLKKAKAGRFAALELLIYLIDDLYMLENYIPSVQVKIMEYKNGEWVNVDDKNES